MIKIFNFTYLIFFLFLNNIYTKELSFIGLNKLTVQDLQTLTSVNITSDDIDENDINLILNDLYSSSLIYDLDLNIKEDIYLIEIFESKKINNIFINNNTFIKDENILQLISSKTDDLLNKNILLNDQNMIRDLYEYSGFINTNITTTTEMYSDDRLNIIFNINEGSRVKLNKINFQGNRILSNNYLKDFINTNSTSLLDFFSNSSNFNQELIQNDVSRILNLYQSKGFFDVKVSTNIDQNSFNSFILNFYINEGERVKINRIDFNFEKVLLDDESIAKLNFKFLSNIEKNNSYYDEAIMQNYIDDINQILFDKNIGNFAIQVQLKESENIFFLEVNSIKVDPIYVNRISITGNGITKNKTILNYIQIEPGDIYNKNVINLSENKLNRLKFINKVTVEESINDNQADISFDIAENKKTGNFTLAGFFSSDVGLGLGLGINDINIFGTGNELKLNSSLSSENILFNLSYIATNKNNSNIKSSYSIYNQEKDLTDSFGFKSQDRGLGYSISINQNQYLSYTVGVSYSDFNGHSAVDDNLPTNENLGDTQNFISNFSINYNNLNDYLYPTDGLSNDLYIAISPEFISDDSFYKIGIKNQFFKEIGQNNNFVFIQNNLGLADSFNGNLKTIHSYSLGGLNFKGFDYRGVGQFLGNTYLGGNKYITSTFGIGSNLFFDKKDNLIFKSFVSAGSLWDSDYITDSDFELRSSIGLSLDILTPLAPISISYAVPVIKKQNDKVRQFNFSLGTSF